MMQSCCKMALAQAVERMAVFEKDQLATRYLIEGEGPAVVLIHGVGARLENWDGVCERLARHFRVLRYDLRYCSSLTFSIQSTALPLRRSWMAICVIAVVAVAPCQCFSPA